MCLLVGGDRQLDVVNCQGTDRDLQVSIVRRAQRRSRAVEFVAARSRAYIPPHNVQFVYCTYCNLRTHRACAQAAKLVGEVERGGRQVHVAARWFSPATSFPPTPQPVFSSTAKRRRERRLCSCQFGPVPSADEPQAGATRRLSSDAFVVD